MGAPTVSVIVPVLNEEPILSRTLKDLRARPIHELIVVDGGSSDRSVEYAQALASRTLADKGGLAAQLNRGAREATGEVLLFHHADARLPDTGLASLSLALERREVVGGAFRLGFDSPRLVYRLIAFGANLRNRLGLGPFGDQAIFVRREVFERIGGYSPTAVLEDLDLVRRIRREGRFVILGPPLRSSVRRWEQDGVVRTTFRHLRVSVLYLLGARTRAETLKSWLQRRRGGG